MAFLFDGMFYFVHFVGASFAYSVTFADKTINEQLKPALKWSCMQIVSEMWTKMKALTMCASEHTVPSVLYIRKIDLSNNHKRRRCEL